MDGKQSNGANVTEGREFLSLIPETSRVGAHLNMKEERRDRGERVQSNATPERGRPQNWTLSLVTVMD